MASQPRGPLALPNSAASLLTSLTQPDVCTKTMLNSKILQSLWLASLPLPRMMTSSPGALISADQKLQPSMAVSSTWRSRSRGTILSHRLPLGFALKFRILTCLVIHCASTCFRRKVETRIGMKVGLRLIQLNLSLSSSSHSYLRCPASSVTSLIGLVPLQVSVA